MNLEKIAEKLHARGARIKTSSVRPRLRIPAVGAHALASKVYLFRDEANNKEEK